LSDTTGHTLTLHR